MLLSSPYKISTLAESPEYYDQVINLIEKNFGYILPHRYEVDFHPLMNQSNHNHCFILLKEDELVGHIGVKQHHLTYQDHSFETCFIGGIVINEKFQGQGLFHQFFEHILNQFSHIPLLALWSDKHELYAKYGFSLEGNVYCYSGLDQPHPQERSLAEIKKDEWEQIKSVFNQVMSKNDILHVDRQEEDWLLFQAMPSVKILLFHNDQNQIEGYALKNKGMDLQGIVHEYVHLNPTKNLKEVLSWGTLWHFQEFLGKPEYMEQRMGLTKINFPTLRFLINQFDLFIGGIESI